VSETPSSEPEIEILSSSAEPEEDFKSGEEKKAPPAADSTESEEWSKKYEELKEKLVWMAADFDNYKKRTLKEREEDRKFSEAKLLKEFLVVVDNLERAMTSLPADDVDKGLLNLKQGVEMTLRQFKSLLEQHGVTKVKTVGEKFDPRFHEVMFQEATDKFPEDTVMEELQSGYLLHERVLRPALVKVAKKP